MGQLSLTIVISLFVYLTYYLVMFGVIVNASANTVEHTADEMNVAQQGPSDLNRNSARLFKPLSFAYNRNIRTPFSSSMNQRFVPVASPSRSKIQPLEVDLVVEDDDFFDKSKRYDDYGHMRFGKRGDDQFDDYGHMRFGKRGE